MEANKSKSKNLSHCSLQHAKGAARGGGIYKVDLEGVIRGWIVVFWEPSKEININTMDYL